MANGSELCRVKKDVKQALYAKFGDRIDNIRKKLCPKHDFTSPSKFLKFSKISPCAQKIPAKIGNGYAIK